MNPARNIRNYYYIALLIMVLLNLLSALVVMDVIWKMDLESQLVNTTGRQRMRAQSIAKNILILTHPNTDFYSAEPRNKALEELKNSLELFKKTARQLEERPNELFKGENSRDALKIFDTLHSDYEDIVNYAEHIIRLGEQGVFNPLLFKENASAHINIIYSFVGQTDQLVEVYTKESTQEQDNALLYMGIIIGLFFICFGVLSFAIINPAAKKITSYIQLLAERNKVIQQNESRLRQNMEELSTLKWNLEKSFKEIEELYNNAPCGYHSLNRDRVFIRINDTALQWLEYSREEVVGKMKIYDVIVPEDHELVTRTFENFLKEGSIQNLPYTFLSKTGKRKPVYLNSTAERDASGNIIASMSATFDRAELLKAQQELMKKQDLLNETESIAKIGGWDLDLIHNELNCTQETFKILDLEYSTQFVSIEHFLSYFPADSHRRTIQQSFEKLKDEGISFDIQSPFKNSAGKKSWIKIIGKSKVDQTGSKHIYGSIQDISDQVEAQLQIKKNERLLDSIINNTNSIIFIKDLESRYLKVNEQFYKSNHVDAQSVIGKSDFDFQTEESAVRLRNADLQVINSGKLTEFEESVEKKEGDKKTYISVKFPLFDEKGQIYAIGGIATDISERKKAELQIQLKNEELETLSEELRQQVEEIDATNEELIKTNQRLEDQTKELEKVNHIKDRLFAIISHDLRSPMNLFRGLIQLMNMGAISEEEKNKLFSELERNTTSILTTLDNLLSWSMAQIEGREVEFEMLPLRKISKEVIDFLDGIAQIKEISIINQLDSHYEVYADADMLKLILRNIISNAIKFTPPKGKVELTCKPLENNMLEISVQDNGVGMSPETIVAIFDNDGLFSTQGTMNEKGTGLGLMLCKDFVEKNGGQIGVESELKKGSRFFFTLRTK